MRPLSHRNINKVKFIYSGDRDTVLITMFHKHGVKTVYCVSINSHWHTVLCDLLNSSSVYYHSEKISVHYTDTLVVSRIVSTSLRMG